jgi:hypothetical protein
MEKKQTVLSKTAKTLTSLSVVRRLSPRRMRAIDWLESDAPSARICQPKCRRLCAIDDESMCDKVVDNNTHTITNTM